MTECHKNAMPNTIKINLDYLPRTVALFVRYLYEQSLASQLKADDHFSWRSAADAARMLGVPRVTINYWCRHGKVKAWQSAPGKHWRVDVEDARQYLISKSV